MHNNKLVMKKVFVFIIAVMSLGVISCSKEKTVEEPNQTATTEVSVVIDPFVLIEEGFEDSGMKLATVNNLDFSVFNVNNNCVVSIHFDTVMTSARTVKFALSPGEYTFVAVGNNSTLGPSIIESPSLVRFTNNILSDIYCDTIHVNIDRNYTTRTFQMTLNRVTSRFAIIPTDTIPANVVSLRETYYSGGTILNPSTGMARDSEGYISSHDGVSSHVGQANIRFSRSILLNSDEQVMDVKVEALDANNAVVASRTFTNITLKRNCITVAIGRFYAPTDTLTTSFIIDTVYLPSDTTYFK